MTKHKNIISFSQRPSTGSTEDYQIGPQVGAWMLYVGAIANAQTGEFYVNVTTRPNDKRPARQYHYWLLQGVLIHNYGFDVANHFIKLPLSWLSVEVTPEKTEVIDGETIVTPAVTREDIYYKGLRKNDTHCLVKITDDNYEDLKSEIASDLSNIIAEKEYFDAIAENGDFYESQEGGDESEINS